MINQRGASTHDTKTPEGRHTPRFWFAVVMATVAVFGAALALILWLAAPGGRTSNDPNRMPPHSSSARLFMDRAY